jgi:RecA-family ATPase
MHNSLNIENLNNTQLDLIALANDRKQQFTLYCDLAATSTKVWLVKNLLGRGEASAFYGAPGSGKSALVEDMGLHIAAGLPWHGRDVMQGAVCYIALERRLLVERRAIAFVNGMGFPICRSQSWAGYTISATPERQQQLAGLFGKSKTSPIKR